LDDQRAFRARDLRWCGDQLCLRGRVVASIEPNSDWRGLWRVRLPDGGLSDLVTRARDAARVPALEVLNRPRAPARSPNIALCLHLGTSRNAVRSRISAHGGQGGRGHEIHFPVHSHVLRHACGFKLANDGHDTRAIQAYLGHRSIMSTVRYTALTPNRFKSFWKD
jgi:integrase